MGKLIFAILILVLLVVAGCSSKSDPRIDALANCLADKNVKEYGAFWCSNCAKQAKMFGNSDSIIKERGVYIECDPRCDKPQEELPAACKGIKSQPDLCLEKGIEGYPTWEFANGEVLIGVQDLDVLANAAGCENPGFK